MGKRAKGRSLQEFLPLNAAEETILEAAAAGRFAVIGETRPETESDTNTVRATFLRFLALGGDDEAPVHERGLQVQGAWITGTLDLSHAEIAGGLVLTKCHFAETPALYDAQIRGLFSLDASRVPGLSADRLTCHSGVFLRSKFLATREARLIGATIGDNLDCSGGKFENPKGTALIADGIKVDGSVFLNDNFLARGEVRLPGATIGGNLACSDGTFENPKGYALIADRIEVGGSVFMGDKFSARGEVRLLGATIGGDLYCSGGTFEIPKDAAIVCESMAVSGTLFFNRVKIAGGTVNLTVAHVAHLVDDLQSWPENTALDGFVYDSFAGAAPTTAKARLAWLDKQSPEHSGKAKNPRQFRPQPWLQLRKVLREQGHLEDSRQVAIRFEERKRECGVIGEISEPALQGDIVAYFRQWLKARRLRIRRWLRRRIARPLHRIRRFRRWLKIQCLGIRQWLQSLTARGFHRLYGALIGYGYRPAKLFWILVAVWLGSTVLFTIGGHSRGFGPTDPQIFASAAYDPCNPQKTPRANWTRCQTFPRAYPAFYPPLYALDVLLPVGKLGQEDHWAPLAPGKALTAKNWLLAWATQFAVWFDMMFGWIAGLLLVATVTGLAKRHDD